MTDTQEARAEMRGPDATATCIHGEIDCVYCLRASLAVREHTIQSLTDALSDALRVLRVSNIAGKSMFKCDAVVNGSAALKAAQEAR
jgi:hypothetical protein